MSFGPHDYLAHILDECEFLCRSSTGMSIDAFLADPILRRACQRSLEIIGEAAKKVDDAFKAAHPGLPWRDMAAMRDRLIHGYSISESMMQLFGTSSRSTSRRCEPRFGNCWHAGSF